MYVERGVIHYSTTDVSAYAKCQFEGLQRLDVALGRVAPSDHPPDPMRQRLGALGMEHERALYADFRDHFGASSVVHIDLPATATQRRVAVELTLATVSTDAQVIYQPAFESGRIYGSADFLVRSGERWQLIESKLAQRPKEPALVQLGAYAAMARDMGIPLDDDAVLVLGNRTSVTVPVDDLIASALPVRLDFEVAVGARRNGPAVAWGQPGLVVCGFCDLCQQAARLARDIRTVAGLRSFARVALEAAGVHTIDQLAVSTGPVDGLEGEQLTELRAQARLQVYQSPPGAERDAAFERAPTFELVNRAAIDAMPPANAGDIFFDFESDPMWSGADEAPSTPGDGLEYLFGLWIPARADSEYVAFWAHDRAQERQALLEFMDFLNAAIERDPDLHVFHYSTYEPTVLRRAAIRHGVGVALVDEWISSGRFVDLYPVVKAAVRISQPGYGLKRLEPLYMGAQLRVGEVTSGAASIVGYQRYTELLQQGEPTAAKALLQEIEDYNRYDCLSTYRLREWLLSLS